MRRVKDFVRKHAGKSKSTSQGVSLEEAGSQAAQPISQAAHQAAQATPHEASTSQSTQPATFQEIPQGEPSELPQGASREGSQEAPQEISPHTTPSDTERSSSSLQKRLWNEAYDGLKKTESAIVDAYEKILSQELYRNESNHDDCDENTRV
jgi:hypothetical protein